MIREFYTFKAPIETCLIAWVGGLLLVAHGVYSALLSRALVAWYGRFYDAVQSASAVLLAATNATANATEASDGALRAAHDGRTLVSDLLVQFAMLVIPMTLLHPVSKFIRRRYCFAWRIALMREYALRWTALHRFDLEGASQRVQEDTARFAQGVQGCAVDILDAVLTIGVFAPTLVDLGSRVPPPTFDGEGALGDTFERLMLACGDAWMLAVALLFAMGAWIVSLCVASRLVGLEVQNQVAEAELRRRLVLIETFGTTHAADGTGGSNGPSGTSTPSMVGAANGGPSLVELSEVPSFESLGDCFALLRRNYLSIFRNFLAFDAWTGCFAQAMVILPYMAIAPQLFNVNAPVTLGTLVQSTNVFGKVFDAVSMPAFRWSEVNDFRSVLRRLSQFERAVGCGKSVSSDCQQGKLLGRSFINWSLFRGVPLAGKDEAAGTIPSVELATAAAVYSSHSTPTETSSSQGAHRELQTLTV